MRRVSSIHRQRGLSLSSLLLWAIVLVIAAIIGMQVLPVYVEDRAIKKTLETLAHNGDMQEASPNDIMMAFAKQASIDHITNVHETDMIIQKQPGGMVLGFDYQVKIPLVGNASLLLEFNTRSTRFK